MALHTHDIMVMVIVTVTVTVTIKCVNIAVAFSYEYEYGYDYEYDNCLYLFVQPSNMLAHNWPVGVRPCWPQRTTLNGVTTTQQRVK